jgi:hypothetical protein
MIVVCEVHFVYHHVTQARSHDDNDDDDGTSVLVTGIIASGFRP